MSKFIWHLKQLLPLQYVATYGVGGKRYVEVWRMWFGRCGKSRRWETVE